MFALRVKIPKGYSIAPHIRMFDRNSLRSSVANSILGLGQAADHAGVEALPAGSFSSMPKGVVHYVFVDEDSVDSDQRRWGLGRSTT